MPLGQAQLGQLPYMNLARYVPEQAPREPAWHKALAAFLVNAAGKTGSDVASNAFARDYTPTAQNLSLPGAASEQAPSALDRWLHGPEWSQQRLETGQKLQQEGQLRQDQMDMLSGQRADQNQSRADALAEQKRFHDQETAAKGESTKLERDRLMEKNITDMDNNTLLNQQEIDRAGDREDARRNETSRTGAYVDAERQRAAAAKAQSDMLAKLMQDKPQGQPADNQSTLDLHSLIGALTGTSPTPQGDNLFGGSPWFMGRQQGQIPGQAQPTGTPADAFSAREAANRAPGGSPSQPGQVSAMQASPTNDAPGITQAQPLAQAVGTTGGPSDALALTRPPQTPNSPTAIQAASTGNFMPPSPDDPRIAALLAAFARKNGQAQGLGGNPVNLGGGAAPMPY